MNTIKRILWIEDNRDLGIYDYLFPDAETRVITTMDEALDEIAGTHLYDYDTIVLDIDFSNGVPNGVEGVIEKLSERLYLNEKDKEQKEIILNGGYLLCMYLLERGYPSDQIAFFTGNPGMVKILREYLNDGATRYDGNDIANLIIDTWNKTWSGKEESAQSFITAVERLPIGSEYKLDVMKYARALYSNDEEEVRKIIDKTNADNNDAGLENTGDEMIYKFHKANLEPPVFFSKGENDISGHNRKDAEKWLDNQRTEKSITRWLILSAGDYMKQLFDSDQTGMQEQMANLFAEIDGDPGIYASFSQLYNLFYGLRDLDQKGPYYQAIASMLIPFDRSPYSSNAPATSSNLGYDGVRRAFARLSKQSRNYCSHNYFGSQVSNRTALYIIMSTLSAVLTRNQRQSFDSWYDDAKSLISNRFNYDLRDNNNKIDQIGRHIFSSGDVNDKAFHVLHLPRAYDECNPWQMLQTIGYNKRMDLEHEGNIETRENFYVFSLAAYVVKWFAGFSEMDIENQYGHGITVLFQLSNEIVAEYQYPYLD